MPALAAAGARVLERGETDAIAALARRRLAREPVARILGSKEFWSLKLRVDAATLVPRPETETVVEAALAARRCRRRAVAFTADCRSRHRLRRPAAGAVDRAAVLERRRHRYQSRCACRRPRQRPKFAIDPRGIPRRRHDRGAERTVRPDRRPIRPTSAPATSPRSRPRCAISIRGPRSTAGPTGSTTIGSLPPRRPALLGPGGAVIVELGVGQAPAVSALFSAAGLVPCLAPHRS